jgi:HD-like signal output (HDOD) protein
MSLMTTSRPSVSPGISDVKAHVLRRAADFTMIPAAAMDAMQVGRNPACSFREYSRAIERDVRLTADILCMANSSLYSTGSPAATLQDAVSRIGLLKCQGLILSTCTAGLMKKLPFQHAQVREKLWRHGYLTAVVCQHLNQSLRLGFNGEEYTAGLMHDLGRSLIAATTPELYAQVQTEVEIDARRALEIEREILGTDHSEIGGEFGARNGLPPQLVAVIRYHNAPDQAGEHSTIATVVALAAQISSRLERDRPAVGEEEDSVPSSSLITDMARLRDVLAALTRETLHRGGKLMPD